MKALATRKLKPEQQSSLDRSVCSVPGDHETWADIWTAGGEFDSHVFNVRTSNSGGAVFDRTGDYRYLLWRNVESVPVLNSDKGTLLLVMLNPNKADETRNDPTIRRCIGFAQRWGHRQLEVVNLFAICAEKPYMLRNFKQPIGAHNDDFIIERAKHAGRVIVAWGNHGCVLERDADVLSKLRTSGPLECFGTTKFGMPRHPLYVRSDVKTLLFSAS